MVKSFQELTNCKNYAFFFFRINTKLLIGVNADKGENTFNRRISLAFISELT